MTDGKDRLLMTAKERKRLHVVQSVLEGRVSRTEGAGRSSPIGFSGKRRRFSLCRPSGSTPPTGRHEGWPGTATSTFGGTGTACPPTDAGRPSGSGSGSMRGSGSTMTPMP